MVARGSGSPRGLRALRPGGARSTGSLGPSLETFHPLSLFHPRGCLRGVPRDPLSGGFEPPQNPSQTPSKRDLRGVPRGPQNLKNPQKRAFFDTVFWGVFGRKDFRTPNIAKTAKNHFFGRNAFFHFLATFDPLWGGSRNCPPPGSVSAPGTPSLRGPHSPLFWASLEAPPPLLGPPGGAPRPLPRARAGSKERGGPQRRIEKKGGTPGVGSSFRD